MKLRKQIAAITLAFVLVRAARPPQKPLKQCSRCDTWNEPDRTTCIGCGAAI